MISIISRKIKGLIWYLRLRNVRALTRRIFLHERFDLIQFESKTVTPKANPNLIIVSTPHVLFLANKYSKVLKKVGIQNVVVTKMPLNFDADFYIVFCAQMFKTLPPSHKLVIVQLEQHTNSRWFTRKYFKTLKSAMAVVEYAPANLPYLHSKGILFPHLYLVKPGPDLQLFPNTVKRDGIVFYGDSFSSKRRTSILRGLEAQHSIQIINNTFGDELYEILESQKILVNLHYGENSMLEVVRLWEGVSLGLNIVSEDSFDTKYYDELKNIVTFVDEGNLEELSELLTFLNTDINELNSSSLVEHEFKFEASILRFLLGIGLIDFERYLLASKTPKLMENQPIVLTLPEVYERNFQFLEKYGKDNFNFFSGLRSNKSWVGCARSYKYLSIQALEQDLKTLTIVEDDAILPENFENNYNVVLNFLDSIPGQWDVFVGLIADLPSNYTILNVIEFEGRKFVFLDCMTSMIFNIYAEESLKHLSKWNEADDDMDNNTIDRYLNRMPDLKVVTILPFFVNQDTNLHSTLWNFRNTAYEAMIRESEGRLVHSVETWKLNRN